MTIPLWLLAALAAAAYLALRRPAPAAALPPLSPLPMPTLSPVPSASGPSPWLLGAILGAGAMIGIGLHSRPVPAPPGPGPAPAVGLDLRGRFVGETAAEDAGITAALLEELAGVIEFDGKQTEPRLRSGAAFADLRSISREYRTRGVSLGQRQPLARDSIKAFLDQEVGTDGGPVDAAARAKWVTAFRGVAAAARAAVGR